MHIFIYFLISSVICWLFRNVLFKIHMFVFFIVFFYLFIYFFLSVQFSRSVVSDSLWTHGLASFTTSWNLLKLMSIELVMPSNHLILCCPLLLPSVFPDAIKSIKASESFQMSQLFTSVGQSIGVSASTSVLQMNTQDRSPLGWTGWISLQSKEPSRVFNTTVQKHQFFSAQLSL